MAKAKARLSRRSPWFKLMLIPYALVFYLLMGFFDLHNLDFLKRFMDYWGRSEYILNFVCAFSSLAGLLLLVFGPTKYRLVTALGLVLFLMPVWLQGNPEEPGNSSEAYALSAGWNFKVFLYELSVVFWAFLPVRGERNTEWIKPLLAVVLLGVQALVLLSGANLYDAWLLYISILPLSLLTGFVLDFVLNGFSLQALLPAIVLMIAVLLDVLLPGELATATLYRIILWTLLALSVASFIVLIIKNPVKNSGLGGLMTLLYIIVSVLVFIVFLLGRTRLPEVVGWL